MKAKISKSKKHMEHDEWDYPAILVSLHGKYVLSSGKHTELQFEGTCIYSTDNSEIGHISQNWHKDHFSIVKGEITLKLIN
jgi:hypothetical protein